MSLFPASWTLRSATPQDIPQIAPLWRDAWASANPAVPTVAPLAHWAERVDAEFGPPCTNLLVEQEGAVVAFMVLELERSDQLKLSQGHLHQLFVAPGAQGQGLGAALVQQIGEQLCPQGWTLHVATTNVRARRFYARCGLVEEMVDHHPGTGRERVLCRWLPPSALR